MQVATTNMIGISCKDVANPHWVNSPIGASPGEVHLYLLNYRQLSAETLALLSKQLNDKERCQQLRFKQQSDRQRYAAAHGLLRWIGQYHTGLGAATLQVDTTPSGKPFFPDFPWLRFNLSHAGDLVLVGIRFDGKELGIDVEPLFKKIEIDSIIRYYFSPSEKQDLYESYSTERFFRMWTRKEAVLKALGTGLTEDLSSLSVVNGDQYWRPNNVDCMTLSHLMVSTFTVDDQYAISIALETPGVEMTCLDLTNYSFKQLIDHKV